jgi:putative membrane protein insertion efficiency factor
MTKEIPMTNVETSPRTAVSNWSFRLRHFLVISASSLVIHVLVFAIRVYRWTISPALTFLFGPTDGCRFTPSCSQYALEAIHTHGAIAGGWLAAKRICRCHPWGEGGHDPVPECGARPSALRYDAARHSSIFRSRAAAEDGEVGI